MVFFFPHASRRLASLGLTPSSSRPLVPPVPSFLFRPSPPPPPTDHDRDGRDRPPGQRRRHPHRRRDHRPGDGLRRARPRAGRRRLVAPEGRRLVRAAAGQLLRALLCRGPHHGLVLQARRQAQGLRDARVAARRQAAAAQLRQGLERGDAGPDLGRLLRRGALARAAGHHGGRGRAGGVGHPAVEGCRGCPRGFAAGERELCFLFFVFFFLFSGGRVDERGPGRNNSPSSTPPPLFLSLETNRSQFQLVSPTTTSPPRTPPTATTATRRRRERHPRAAAGSLPTLPCSRPLCRRSTSCWPARAPP